MSTEPIRIARKRGGEVEVDGPVDEFAAQILDRAGFIFRPTLRGVWIRLHFDTGQENENRQATYAAQMLSAAGYQVDLDPNLLPAAGHRSPVNGWPPRTGAVMPQPASHSAQQRRH
ncbi:hypothetical protein GCM10010211_19880 [Streptomyces albospinus]|uniref:Uncharacterized protein n=1 Tax=Streptomyces albospinus TaxID=285515 RepID=A0ABQ2UUV7_9ACTN|nr:hypothetical protein [Streptomyces albospinus]GGU55220.1 hypothetical protein GCM10010211_19880 [Streptomyces albospinus]